MSGVTKKLLDLQELLLKRLHPVFIKGAISVCIGAITFLSVYFGTDVAKGYIGALAQWIVLGLFGLVGIILNQSRDALSAYYADKNKTPAATGGSSSDTTISTNKPQS